MGESGIYFCVRLDHRYVRYRLFLEVFLPSQLFVIIIMKLLLCLLLGNILSNMRRSREGVR